MQKRYDQLEAKIKKANPSADIERIRLAFECAFEAHKGQKRLDGQPYISHPLAVADIICEMGLDADSIIAGLLHDCLEDTMMTYDDIKVKFGTPVADLVDGVTRLGKIQYSSKEERQMEDLRKMFLAMAKDIRVILIKLADRLHNMRTIGFVSERKQREKALETMEVYAPIAHRLGMQRIKWELEDLSLKALDPVGYNEIMEDLSEKSSERDEFLDHIKHQIDERLKEMGISAQIDGRIKHIYSIYRKMYAQHKTMNEIYDICAVRVIVETIADCYNVLGFIHDIFKPIPGRFKDYISTPKPNMYQSLHTTVIGREGIPFEVQIRTKEMHHLAEYGVAAHWKYKEGLSVNNPADESTFAWIRQLLEAQQDSDAEDFIRTLKVDLFADEVFVFTPKGDVINLPAGATPIDFAYAIHTAVGNRMIGAKVNGRIVQLDCQLKNGEIVDVLTSKETHGPSRDWLKIVKTSEARNKIKQWFKNESREENVQQGKEELEKQLNARLLYTTFMKDEIRLAVIKKLSFNSLEELYAGIGYGGVTVNRVVNRIRDEMKRIERQKPSEIIEGTQVTQAKKTKQPLHGVIVGGLDSCLVKFARCCTPIPGDEIIGFITRGYGVSIHRIDCPNVRSAKEMDTDKGRWVVAHWDERRRDKYETGIQISAKNRSGLLGDVVAIFSNLKLNVEELSARNLNDGYAVITAVIQVSDTHQLDDLFIKLKRVAGIIDIIRSNS
ncbi:MAG: bifunctional (p)ppGpp synthetase/guanosine-3',5'-bis(diphosphate) 3'-pyrophosphohydrolase [Clostridiales bacterium]|nr:bifunctional (p)ppGpp synthetase/guanosine-3',5'-bis(diphosphate) 3'-pyrophosphohydrolase [Clostridiales bacterium]